MLERAQGVGHLAQRPQHHALVVGCGGIQRRQKGALLRRQAGVEQGLGQLAQHGPRRRGAAEQGARGQSLAAQAGTQLDLRIEPGHRHAVVGGGGVQQGLGRPDVGAGPHQLGRQRHRQHGGQAEFGQREIGHLRRARRLPGQHGQPVIALIELLAQRGQAGTRLLDLRLQGQQLVGRRRAQAHALAGQALLLLLRAQQRLGGRDLPGQPGAPDGAGGQAAGQRQAGAVQLVAALVGAGGQRLQRAPVAARHIEPIAHAQAGAVQVELACVTGLPLHARVQALALRAEGAADLRVQRGAGLRGVGLVGLPQGGLGRGQRGAGGEGQLDPCVQPLRAQLAPPACIHRRAHRKALGRTQGSVGRRRLRRQRRHRVAGHGGRRRALEVGAGSAAGQQAQGRQRWPYKRRALGCAGALTLSQREREKIGASGASFHFKLLDQSIARPSPASSCVTPSRM